MQSAQLPQPSNPSNSLLEVIGLKTFFPVVGGVFRSTMGFVKAVNDVTFSIQQGEVVSVVGESGCGKSTLGYSILGLTPPTEGSIKLQGRAIDIAKPASWNSFRQDFQIIFQDPYTSLNPRHTIFEILSEPMRAHPNPANGNPSKAEMQKVVADLLELVGLDADYMNRFPHAFSGGQRQRIGIARALALKPKLLVCDEVVAALDVSVQAQIIQLLMDLKDRLGLSLLFISHDLSLVKSISDRVLVMYLGKIVESGSAEEIFSHPHHPYTAALLESIPTLNRSRRPKLLGGEIPSPVNLPEGCAFAGRCSHAQEKCKKESPVLIKALVDSSNSDQGEAANPGEALNPSQSMVACFYPLE